LESENIEESLEIKRQKLEQSTEPESTKPKSTKESMEICETVELIETIPKIIESEEIERTTKRCTDCGAVYCRDCYKLTPTPPAEIEREREGSHNSFVNDVAAGNFTPSPSKDMAMENPMENPIIDDNISDNNNQYNNLDEENLDNNNSNSPDNSKNNPDSKNGPNSGSDSGASSVSNPSSGPGNYSGNSRANTSNSNNNNDNDNNQINLDNIENNNRRCTIIEYSFILFSQVASILSDCLNIFL
jgi:hypothetical protein